MWLATCITALIDSGQRGAKHSPFSMHDDDGDAAANNDAGDGDGGDDGGVGVAFVFILLHIFQPSQDL